MEIIQRLPISLTQVKVGKIYLAKLNISNIICTKQKKWLKVYITSNEFSRDIIQNRYYVYVFKKSETSAQHSLVLNLAKKTKLKESDIYTYIYI